MIHPVLAHLSDRLMWSATVVYSLALLAAAVEWAFGDQNRSVEEPITHKQATALPARQLAVAAAPTDGVRGGAPAALDTGCPPEDPAPPQARAGRAERCGRAGLSLAALGLALHTGGVLTRGLSVQRVPWGNMYEFSTASALAAMGVFLVLCRRPAVRRLNVFVLTLVLLTMGLALTVLYTDAEQVQPALQSYWLVIHVIAALTSGGAFTVGAILSAAYLVADRAERRGLENRPRAGENRLTARLPAAAELDRIAYRVHAFAFPLWTFAVIAGAIWAENAWGRYWGWDPKETWAFITWVVYAAYLHARATGGWKGRRAAGIALVGFTAFLFNYFVINMVITGLHSYAGT